MLEVLNDKRFWKLKDPTFKPSKGSNLDLYEHHSKCRECVNILFGQNGPDISVHYKDIPTIEYLTNMGTSFEPAKSIRDIQYDVVQMYRKSKLDPSFLEVIYLGGSVAIHYNHNDPRPGMLRQGGLELRRSIYGEMFYNFFYNHVKMTSMEPSGFTSENYYEFTFTTPEEFLKKYS